MSEKENKAKKRTSKGSLFALNIGTVKQVLLKRKKRISNEILFKIKIVRLYYSSPLIDETASFIMETTFVMLFEPYLMSFNSIEYT